MTTVTVTEVIDAPIERVWALVCDVASYPQLMEPVQSIEVLEERAEGSVSEAVSAWEILLKGSILKWVEREVRNHDLYRIDYEQVSGDMEVFRGHWQLVARPDGRTEATLYTELEIGIPMLADMLEPVAVRALRQNASWMLQSLNPQDRS